MVNAGTSPTTSYLTPNGLGSGFAWLDTGTSLSNATGTGNWLSTISTWTGAATSATTNITLGWYELYYNAPVPETAAQVGARLAHTARCEIVRQTAECLLLAHLTDAQRATWLKQQYVDVRSAGGRRYRVKGFQAGNVFLLDAHGREVRKYCAYAADPGGTLPLGDHVFLQLLTLQFNEREFLAKANTWDLLRQGHPFVGQGVDAVPDLDLAAAA